MSQMLAGYFDRYDSQQTETEKLLSTCMYVVRCQFEKFSGKHCIVLISGRTVGTEEERVQHVCKFSQVR